MIVSNIRTTLEPDGCQLRADVRCDTHWVWGSEPFRLWVRFPAECAAALDPEVGTPFVAVFLAPAMVLGEPLEIMAPVSLKLLEQLLTIQSIYRRWYPTLSEIRVVAPPPQAPKQAKRLRDSLADTGQDRAIRAAREACLVRNGLRASADTPEHSLPTN